MGKVRINKAKLKKKKKRAKNLTPSQSKLTKEQCAFVDYKDVETLSKFVSGVGKILPRKRTGTTHREQRMVTDAIKLSRFMALMPFINRR